MANSSRWPGNDLDAAQRRRLWIVELVLEGGTYRNSADAFDLALRLERFISSGLDSCERGSRENGPYAARSGDRSGLLSPAAPATSTQASVAPASQQPSRNDAGPVRPVRPAPSLGAGQAGKLNLTRRPQRCPGRAASSEPHLSRDEELALQQQFLRQRAPAPCTVDDVIRYLRQRGDSVVTHDGGYLVNERLVLTKDQLVARANRQRKHMGAPLFSLGNADIASLDAPAPSL
jgi:hypothetical protein